MCGESSSEGLRDKDERRDKKTRVEVNPRALCDSD